MTVANKTNILIVGAGKGGTALIETLNGDLLINILGVVDLNPKAPGIKLAKELGIPTADSWKSFIKDKKLDEIIDVTGDPETYEALLKDRPEHVEVIGGSAAKTVWLLLDERYKAEGALHESEEKLKTLITNINDVIFQLSPLGIIQYVNPSVETLYGYKPEGLIGKHLSKTTPVSEVPRALSVLKRALSGEAVKNFVVNQLDSKGKLIPMEVDITPVKKDGRVIAVQGVMRDISERTNAAEEILKLHYAVEQSPSTVIITDIKGNIEYVNPRFTYLTGYMFNEVKGKNPHILKSGEHPVGVYEKLWETITSGREWRGEFHNKKKNGELYWEFATIAPIKNAAGTITNFLKVSEDITQKKETEKQLEEAKEELELQAWGLKKANEGIKLLYKELDAKNKELQKLDQLKDDFISTVSHELRTPLSITKEGLSLLLDRIPGDINEKQAKILSVAKDNMERLGRLINNLLDISKIEAGKVVLKRKMLNISKLADDIAALFEAKAQAKGLEVKTNLARQDLEVYADSDKLTQVFTNLIGNAMKFTDKGYIEISVKDTDKDVECAVTDTGKGISKEDLSKVFSKFQQFGRTAGAGEKGTGLGLSISKGIVELHKGRIWIESELGKGTSFIFSLPKYNAESLLFEFLAYGIERAKKEDTSMTFTLVSIADFDKVKKEYPAERIDELLGGIEDIAESTLRHTGDFTLKGPAGIALILVDCNRESSKKVTEKLSRALKAYIENQGMAGKLKLGFGYAEFPDEAKTPEELIEIARNETEVS